MTVRITGVAKIHARTIERVFEANGSEFTGPDSPSWSSVTEASQHRRTT
jgi:hypothetical protein